MIGEMPLVGRAGPLDRMVTRLKDDSPAAFVVTGSAGVGKSRLAAEVARAAAGMGRVTAHVVATKAARTIPFGAFAPLVPEMPGSGTGLLDLLLQTSTAILERTAGDGPLLLVVDDAHLLDDGSAALVHQLVHSSSCSLVASVRTPGPAPDPITTLWKDGLADRLDLTPLSEAEAEELVRSTLGAPITGPGVRWLWETSAGNPLYVRELLSGALGTGALTDHGGMWVLRLPFPAPTRLSELVASRLAGLPEETAEVVDLLAVGEPIDLSLLGAVVPSTAIEDAEQRGLIAMRELDRSPEVGLSHPLYGEIRRKEMPRVRLRRLSATLAEALSARGPRRQDDELRIARWQLDAGAAVDPALLERAARTARDRYDLELAARLGRVAVSAGAGVGAGLALAEAEFFSGRHVAAEEVLAELVAKCRTDEELSLVTNARAYNLGTLMGDASRAEAVVDAALAEITEPGPRCRLVYRQSVDRVYSGRPRLALEGALEVLADGDEVLQHRGSYVASVALALLGRTEESAAMATRGLELHCHSGDVTRLPEGQLIGGVLGHSAGGRLSEAEAAATIGYEASLHARDQDALATFCLLRGWVHLDRGSMAEAARMFREGLIINRELRDVAPQRFCLGGVALSEAMAGQADRAAAAVRELDALPRHWMDAFEPDLMERGRAWTQAAAGEMSAGRATLHRAAREAEKREQPVTEARLMHDMARLGEPGPASERLAHLAGVVDGFLVAALAEHAAALARPSGKALEAAARRFDEMGAWGLAAEAARSASAAYRDEGLIRAAAASGRFAADTQDRCGVPAPPSATSSAQAARLTRREREVAALAATGISSREIAERLFLSVRTVDNHLQRVYAKVGVTSREELAAALQG
jgi:DNA-binding CsgD family transcriptional regulator